MKLRGRVKGTTIMLEEDPKLPNGVPVTVEISISPEVGRADKILELAGTLADAEWDEIVRAIYDTRTLKLGKADLP